jgi:phenylacetate-coenzyme A ligase PaaK-like adenylate-forming protein
MLTMSRADELREYLLPLTISHAVHNSPFYRERLGDLAECVQKLDDLQKLPLLDKSDLQEHADKIRTSREFPDYLMYTSGTTGIPLEVPVYREEVEAYNRFVLSAWRKRLGGDCPLTIAILRVGHGSHVLTRQIPTLPCHINYGLDLLIHMLKSTHWVNGSKVRVTNLEANVLDIRKITKELLAKGVDPSQFGLETISISGWYISTWERRYLQEIWNVLLLDRYGVTEVHGDAKWCHDCEYYHFDFIVIPEILNPDTHEVIDEGIGLMVLTGLYPFNQAVPKIRYLIGDLVEVRKTTCGSHERGVRFLSRTKDVVRVTSSVGAAYRLFSSDVVEALAPLPDIVRKENTSFLKFRLSSTPQGQAHIDVELTYPPMWYPSRVKELEKHIIEVLRQRSMELGEPEIVFVGPGQLREITKI